MPWEFSKAVKRGNTVTVTCVNADDPENVQERQLTWTQDPDQKPTEFVAMVKRETRNFLAHWNAQEAEVDVTEEFRPVAPA